MTDNRTIIATFSREPPYVLTRCIHTEKELTELLEYKNLDLVILPHGLVTQKELDEN